MTLEIRDATDSDAEAACDVMCRSITELCVEDHRGDPGILGRWLANKKPAVFRGWLARDGQSYLVAAAAGRIAAVGAVTNDGEITLNYVAPEARFRGVSDAMLAALERRARERGNSECRLSSTSTARRFYKARGYAETGAVDRHFGTDGFWMRKAFG